MGNMSVIRIFGHDNT